MIDEGFVRREVEALRLDFLTHGGLSPFLQLVDTARWRVRHVTGTDDVGSLAAHSGVGRAISLPAGSAKVGDLVVLLGDTSTANYLIRTLRTPVVTVADQVTISLFNADTAANDAPAITYHFLIINVG